MSRINNLFKKKEKRVLNVYCTAGYPQLHSTIEVMKALQENGADLSLAFLTVIRLQMGQLYKPVIKKQFPMG